MGSYLIFKLDLVIPLRPQDPEVYGQEVLGGWVSKHGGHIFGGQTTGGWITGG